MLKGMALVVWCYWSEQWCLCSLKSSTVSTVAKWVKLGRLLYSFSEEGLVFFWEVRSKNELIPTVCYTILINRPVSEVIPIPISRQEPINTCIGTWISLQITLPYYCTLSTVEPAFILKLNDNKAGFRLLLRCFLKILVNYAVFLSQVYTSM